MRKGRNRTSSRGGKRFFAEHSPIVQFELQRDGEIELRLVDAFESPGYDAYRLALGPGVPVLFSREAPQDIFQRNLFVCQPGRAAALDAKDLLMDRHALEDSREWFGDIASEAGALDASSWRHTLTTFPHGAALANRGPAAGGAGIASEIEAAPARHAGHRTPTSPPSRNSSG